MDKVYEGLRRWAVREQRAADRPGLCRELARVAKLYGILSGKADGHTDRKVEAELRHLRAMGFDVHQPLSLRLLDDAEGEDGDKVSNEDLALTFGYIGTWISRLWLAGRPTAGLNKAVAELAHGPGPPNGENFSEYWLGRIQKLSFTRTGVPGDEEVREGIQSRRAYGGGATQVTFAVLCAMMEFDHKDQSPDRKSLTVEHVMPQKLTDEWRNALGEEAEQVHGQYRDLLSNLTLCGYVTNPSMGAKSFDEKKQSYKESTIGMTRKLADQSAWNVDALQQRAECLAKKAITIWPWQSPASPHHRQAPLRWRIDGGDWHSENTASQMVLNVTGMLIAIDHKNVQRLSGDVLTRDVYPASSIPADSKGIASKLKAVTGSDDLFMYPYTDNYTVASKRCRDMGQRCGAKIEVEIRIEGLNRLFWTFLKENTGGIPGQKETWRGPSQYTSPVNTFGDRVGIYVGNPDLLWLYVRAGTSQNAHRRSDRMRHYSYIMQQNMSDQILGENVEKNANDGITISVKREWIRDDEDEWLEAAFWIREQQERLAAILTQD